MLCPLCIPVYVFSEWVLKNKKEITVCNGNGRKVTVEPWLTSYLFTMVDVKHKLKRSLIKYFRPTHNNNCLVKEWDEWTPICFLVRFFNNHPDNYVLAYPHKQKNNLPSTAEEQSCLCHSLYWLWREWCFAVLKAGSQWPVSQSSEAGSQNKNKGCLGIDVARPPGALGQGPDRLISRDR